MQLRPEQLQTHLQQQLLGWYVLVGEEPLLTIEATDQIRLAARARGFDERLVLHAGADFDWSELYQLSHAPSLFSNQQIIELHLERKPDKTAQEALVACAQAAPPEQCWVVHAQCVDRPAQKTQWFKQFTQHAGLITLWPVRHHELPKWLQQRARQMGLSLTPEAMSLLVDLVDGHLLAAQQELQKLQLLYETQTIDAQIVLESVSDHARFTVFDWINALHHGELARAQRMLDYFQAAGTEPLQLQWMLAREVRIMMALQQQLGQGVAEPQACTMVGLRGPQQASALCAVRRVSAGRWRTLFELLQRIDAAVKGAESLSPWILLGQVVLRWAR